MPGYYAPWSAEEDSFLRENMPYRQLPEWIKTCRTADAVRSRQRRMGVRSVVVDRESPVPQVSPRLLVAKPQEDEDWESLFCYIEDANAQRESLVESVKHIEWEAPVAGPIAIAFFSDLHAGAGGVLYRQFREDMETLATTDGLFGIFNGDAFENTKPQSKSGTALYSSVFANPREQYEYVLRRASVAQGKWIAWTQGNHDAWDYRQAGIDRLPDLSRALSCPYATEAGANLDVCVGGFHYSITVKHDYRGKSQINKSNSGRRLYLEFPNIMDQITADVVALAHLHEPDLHTTMMRGFPVTMLRSGTYKIHDSWAEGAGYKPAYGVPVVILYPDRKQIVPIADFATAVRFLASERAAYQ